MFPNSTKPGVAVRAFPDVCSNVPQGPTPMAIAYPNIARSSQTKIPGKVTTTPVPTPSVGVSVGPKTATTGSAKTVVKLNTSTGYVLGGVVMTGGMFEGSPVVPSLRNQLSLLHSQISRLGGSDPNRWHELVDEYVQVTAHLYIALAEARLRVT